VSLDDFLVPDGLNPRSKKDFLFNGVAVSTIPGTHLGPNILAEAARLSKEDNTKILNENSNFALAVVLRAEIAEDPRSASAWLRGHARRFQLQPPEGSSLVICQVYAASDKYHCGAGSVRIDGSSTPVSSQVAKSAEPFTSQPIQTNNDGHEQFSPAFYALVPPASVPPVGSVIEVRYLSDEPYGSGVWRLHGGQLSNIPGIFENNALSSMGLAENGLPYFGGEMSPKDPGHRWEVKVNDPPQVKVAKQEYNKWGPTGAKQYCNSWAHKKDLCGDKDYYYRDWNYQTWNAIAMYWKDGAKSKFCVNLTIEDQIYLKNNIVRLPNGSTRSRADMHWSGAFIQFCMRTDPFFKDMVWPTEDRQGVKQAENRGLHSRYIRGSMYNTFKVLDGYDLKPGEYVYIPMTSKMSPLYMKRDHGFGSQLQKLGVNAKAMVKGNYATEEVMRYKSGDICQKISKLPKSKKDKTLIDKYHGDIAVEDQPDGKTIPGDRPENWKLVGKVSDKRFTDAKLKKLHGFRIGGNVGGAVAPQLTAPCAGYTTNRREVIEALRKLGKDLRGKGTNIITWFRAPENLGKSADQRATY